jgi:CspA family cold shock protein
MKEQGTVQWFSTPKGYGFIRREGAKDLFCHFSQIQSKGFKSLNPGDVVEFSIGEGPKGPQAVDVVVVGKGNQK